MPNIKSKSKHLRKTKKRQQYNRAFKSRINTISVRISNLIAESDFEQANKELSQFYKVADKAMVKGVLKKNTVARKKSSLAKLLYSSTNSADEAKKEKNT